MTNKTLLYIGAGSTNRLNMPTTEKQIDLLKERIKKEEGILLTLYNILESRFSHKSYDINDIYNFIDNALLMNCGIYDLDKKIFIDYSDLIDCRNRLINIIFDIFVESMSKSIANNKSEYEKLVNFYYKLAKNELLSKITNLSKIDDRSFFVSSYSIINLNWDLFSIFPIIDANARLNKENDYYLPIGHNPKLKMFTDFNYEYASKLDNDKYWYPYTEPVAYRVNDEDYDSTRRVILTKAFYPHGLMNSYKCPKCSKHSLFLGDLTIGKTIKLLDVSYDNKIYDCPYCNTPIRRKDFDVLVQTNFKHKNSFLEEVGLSAVTELENSDVIAFIGYSMPKDDIDKRILFKSINPKKVYVCLYDENWTDNKFIKYFDLDKYFKNLDTTKNYISIFDENILYFNYKGCPDSLDELLNVLK